MAEDVRYFQYLAGPRAGEVLVFDKIEEEDGIVFICFKDGSRCNEKLILPLNNTNYVSELMAEVDSPTNLWVMKEEWVGRQEEVWAWLDETNHTLPEDKVCVVPFNPGKKKITPVPPRPTPPKTSKFGQIDVSNTPDPQVNTTFMNDTKTQQASNGASQQVNSGDPVYLMCEKAKKFDEEIVMTLKVSLPKKSLYDVAKESFENGGQKVIEYIIHNLNDQIIKDSLKEALLEAYEDETETFVPELHRSKVSEESIGTKPYTPEIIEEPVVSGPRAAKGGKELQDFIEDSAAEKGLK